MGYNLVYILEYIPGYIQGSTAHYGLRITNAHSPSTLS